MEFKLGRAVAAGGLCAASFVCDIADAGWLFRRQADCEQPAVCEPTVECKCKKQKTPKDKDPPVAPVVPMIPAMMLPVQATVQDDRDRVERLIRRLEELEARAAAAEAQMTPEQKLELLKKQLQQRLDELKSLPAPQN